jgi:hypothetical protein
MSIHYDKLTFTKEQVLKDAEELNGIMEECDTFYSIVFPFGQDSYTLSDAKNQENTSKPCECSHFSECLDLGGCMKKLTLNK